jgi:CubicO group peptidase (beta-lactamase class C family)
LLTCAKIFVIFLLKKKYIKILTALIILLYVFVFSLNYSESQSSVKAPKNAITTPPKQEPAFFVERYSEKKTKKVRYKLDSLLKRINKRQDFHGSILVAKNKKVLYSNQIGFADFGNKILLNKKSIYQLASVSKQFTAAAIMLLKEDNKIKLSDKVTAYFPNFPYKDVSIKNLLNHTAGLPKYFWLAEHKWQQNEAPKNIDMMALLASTNIMRFFKPGRNFDYSNTGYFVLASIVEKVSGISFRAFLKKYIFEPLQMNDSYVYSYKNDKIKENQLNGYRLYRGWRHLKIPATINDAIVGDKNVYSTSEDLFKWTLGLNTGKLLKKESLDLMYSKGKTIYGTEVPYGFGFRISSNKQKSIYHYGKWNGFRTALTKYLEDDLVVIILEHTSYNTMKSLNKKVKKIVTDNFNF